MLSTPVTGAFVFSCHSHPMTIALELRQLLQAGFKPKKAALVLERLLMLVTAKLAWLLRS